MKRISLALVAAIAAMMLLSSCHESVKKEIEIKTYTVTFDLGGGKPDIPAQRIEEGGKAVRPYTDPLTAESNRKFAFWSTDGENEFKFDETVITSDTVIKAVWKEIGIGDRGPAGGYIFYDCDADNESGNKDGLISSECGWRYLEAAPHDLDGILGWAEDDDIKTISTYYSLGHGKANTEILKEKFNSPAAFGCSNWSDEEFPSGLKPDWFLPSIEELTMMYQNLKKEGKGGTWHSGPYWSSSTCDDENAYYVDFHDGAVNSLNHSNRFHVRPARTFM